MISQADPPALLKLYWPTTFDHVVQRFGARPAYYQKFGLDGHEGIDIRAYSGSKIYACAAGIVSQVGWRWKGHAYGYAVRILHHLSDDELYETIYAHLKEGSARFTQGQAVKAHDWIGNADATGNAQGAHLHLSLKWIGHRRAGYGEMIDPEPFLVSYTDTQITFK